mgnify:CR=1 FL=1
MGLDLCRHARIYFCALICSSCYCWFCSFSYSFPFLTENQIHSLNNPMEHETNGTNCHQECWPGLFSIRKETLLVDNIAWLRWWGSNNDKWRDSSWWERWLSARLWLSVNGMHVLLWESSWFIINNWYIKTHSILPKWKSNKTTLHICMQNKYLVMLNFQHTLMQQCL